MENIVIRLEKKEEQREVENLVRESFWNVYRPGCLEHYVLNQLRNDPAFIQELDFVMRLSVQENDPVDQSVVEQEGKLIGQNMFMKAMIKSDDGSDIDIWDGSQSKHEKRKNGTFVIDTPGMREIGIMNSEDGIESLQQETYIGELK